jgi:hypothetical protein
MCRTVPLLSRFKGLRRPCAGPEHTPGGLRRVPGRTQILEFPLCFEGRIAVLEAGFRMERGMREFDPAAPDLVELLAFGPDAMVVPLGAALGLAQQKMRGALTLASLRLALVVLTGADEDVLAEHHRDLLWRAFGVPVFEQWRDGEGAVAARECEVHDGLHLAAGAVPPVHCEVVTGHCECGAETARMRHAAPLRRRAAAAAA